MRRPAPRERFHARGLAASIALKVRSYARRRAVRLTTGFRLGTDVSPPSRFAFPATCCLYRLTISSADAPAIRLAVASKAACIFSLIMSSASRRAFLSPRASFINRNATTPFASNANIIQEVNIPLSFSGRCQDTVARLQLAARGATRDRGTGSNFWLYGNGGSGGSGIGGGSAVGINPRG